MPKSACGAVSVSASLSSLVSSATSVASSRPTRSSDRGPASLSFCHSACRPTTRQARPRGQLPQWTCVPSAGRRASSRVGLARSRLRPCPVTVHSRRCSSGAIPAAASAAGAAAASAVGLAMARAIDPSWTISSTPSPSRVPRPASAAPDRTAAAATPRAHRPGVGTAIPVDRSSSREPSVLIDPRMALASSRSRAPIRLCGPSEWTSPATRFL